MRTSRSRRCAGALVAVFAATLLLPLVALAQPAPSRRPHGCHCPVKMACCEAGLCHTEDEAAPSSGPSFTGCRDEAPGRAEVPAPSTAFDGALLLDGDDRSEETGAPALWMAPSRVGPSAPVPATPPPRASVASR